MSKKHSQEFVAACFVKAGFVLLDNYTNARALLNCKCVCGRPSKKRFTDVLHGGQKRCRHCYREHCGRSEHSQWNHDRDEQLLLKKVRKKCYRALQTTLEATKQKKTTKTYKLLGYTAVDLKKHIQSHPNWGNVKKVRWHLDHIFPIQAFRDYGIFDIGLINCLDNLQPLYSKQNISKSDNYDKNAFDDWLFEKGVTWATS